MRALLRIGRYKYPTLQEGNLLYFEGLISQWRMITEITPGYIELIEQDNCKQRWYWNGDAKERFLRLYSNKPGGQRLCQMGYEICTTF